MGFSAASCVGSIEAEHCRSTSAQMVSLYKGNLQWMLQDPRRRDDPTEGVTSWSIPEVKGRRNQSVEEASMPPENQKLSSPSRDFNLGSPVSAVKPGQTFENDNEVTPRAKQQLVSQSLPRSGHGKTPTKSVLMPSHWESAEEDDSSVQPRSLTESSVASVVNSLNGSAKDQVSLALKQSNTMRSVAESQNSKQQAQRKISGSQSTQQNAISRSTQRQVAAAFVRSEMPGSPSRTPPLPTPLPVDLRVSSQTQYLHQAIGLPKPSNGRGTVAKYTKENYTLQASADLMNGSAHRTDVSTASNTRVGPAVHPESDKTSVPIERPVAQAKRGAPSWSTAEARETDAEEEEDLIRPLQDRRDIPDTAGEPDIAWFGSVDACPKVDLTESDHHDCDIDTITGEFLPAIKYPRSFRVETPGARVNSRDLAWRHENMTSTLRMANRRTRDKKAAKVEDNRILLESQIVTLPPEHTWPSAACTIRPAKPGDFEQIVAMLNDESLHNCPQFFDSGPGFSRNDVAALSLDCQEHLRPLIVAELIEGKIPDEVMEAARSAKWQENLMALVTSMAPPTSKIVGVAWIDEARYSRGQPCLGSRFSGKIQLLVDPKHRRASFGTALLDRILQLTTPGFRSVIDYDWQRETTLEGVYEFPASNNVRQYARLYFETHYLASDEGGLARAQQKFLEHFGFEKVGHLREALRTAQSFESVNLDLITWEFKAQSMSKMFTMAEF